MAAALVAIEAANRNVHINPAFVADEEVDNTIGSRHNNRKGLKRPSKKNANDHNGNSNSNLSHNGTSSINSVSTVATEFTDITNGHVGNGECHQESAADHEDNYTRNGLICMRF
nr:hypothetical protein BaRGS_028235 [Batillaria attramentaria]